MCSGAGQAGTRVCQCHAHTCELSLHMCTYAPYHTSSHQAAISGTTPKLRCSPAGLQRGLGPCMCSKRLGAPAPEEKRACLGRVCSFQLTLGDSGCLKAGGRLGHGLAGTWIGQGTPPRPGSSRWGPGLWPWGCGVPQVAGALWGSQTKSRVVRFQSLWFAAPHHTLRPAPGERGASSAYRRGHRGACSPGHPRACGHPGCWGRLHRAGSPSLTPLVCASTGPDSLVKEPSRTRPETSTEVTPMILL